jgi:hypothetical protein
MDIDRNFLEEMLIMEEEKDWHQPERLALLPRSEETRSVELTAAEQQLLDSILHDVIAGESRHLPLSPFESLTLRRIRSKLIVKSRERTNAI